MKRTFAFTLIELLVVISIISLLIALLIPALSKVRLTSQETVCMVDIRSLLQASLIYANDENNQLPDISADRDTNRVSRSIYWSFPSWRQFIEGEYGVTRQQWYGFTNQAWNRDDFYYFDTGDPRTASEFVMGRFYLAGTFANSQVFRQAVDPGGGRPGRGNSRGGGRGGGGSGGTTASAYDLSLPMFHTTSDDIANLNFVWTDLNRQWPIGSWITPGDERRVGANHLNQDATWPTGSHVGYLDGHVGWTPGREIKQRAMFGGAGLFW